jgi:hypothetical protein
VRGLVHRAADPVPALVGVDAAATRAPHRTDRRGDVAHAVTDDGRRDAGRQRALRRRHQLHVLRPRRTDREGDRSIPHPAVQHRAGVHAQQVTVVQHLGGRDPVQRHVVDRQAHHARERRRGRERGVAEERRAGSGVGQDVARHRVQPRQPDAGCGGRTDGGQHVGHDGAGRPHRVKLAESPQFDHVVTFRYDYPGISITPWSDHR